MEELALNSYNFKDQYWYFVLSNSDSIGDHYLIEDDHNVKGFMLKKQGQGLSGKKDNKIYPCSP